MSFLMRFALEPEIVTFAWIDNASVQFPLNIYATKGITEVLERLALDLLKNIPCCKSGRECRLESRN